MSSDESVERGGVADGRTREPARDSWFERFKLALGLKQPASIRDDLEDALEDGPTSEADDFTDQERRILRNLLAARDRRVVDVMIPRGSVAGISENATFLELRHLFAQAEHSRLPVYGETLDDPRGMIHIRDMFARLDAIAPETRVADTGLMRPVLFAPASMPALDLLLDMQAKRIHMALVIDEYGETDGLVSLEDLLEIIVGEIEDEHDIVEERNVEMLADGAIAIDAQAEIGEVTARIGIAFPDARDEHDVGTVGGYVTALLGRMPEKGETVNAPNGVVFTVLDADSRRLRRLRVAPPPAPDDDTG